MNIDSISSYIRGKIPEIPHSAVILGSGLGDFINNLDNIISIPYSDIPNYPISTVSGHAGEWIFGYINNKPIICASGRFHYYEGFSLDQVTIPISIIYTLGCKSIIITNAAGCLNIKWKIGDLMIISGYLDYTFRSGPHDPSIVMLNNNSNNKIINKANKLGISVRKGIYSWVLGPSYETRSEIQNIITLGGDAVGMSTVPEIIRATELEMNIIGISCFTNYGAGLDNIVLSHEDVLKASKKINKIFSNLLKEII